jgi:hypothetical protein
MSDKIWDDAVAEGKAKMMESMERAIRRRIEIESSGSKYPIQTNCSQAGSDKRVCQTIDDAEGCPEYMRLHADWMRLRERDQNHLNKELMAKHISAYSHAVSIAEHLWEKHFKESAPGWKPFDDLLGVLNQIDNMTQGCERIADWHWPDK